MPVRIAWIATTIGGRRWAPLLAGLVALLIASITQAGPARSLAEKLSNGPELQNCSVGIVPSSAISIPDGWTLDSDDTIKRTTCHQALSSLDGLGDPMLRDFDPVADAVVLFCGKCHEGNSQRDVPLIHALAVGQAQGPATDIESPQATGSLDLESRRCLSCNDEVTATEHVSGSESSGIGTIG